MLGKVAGGLAAAVVAMTGVAMSGQDQPADEACRQAPSTAWVAPLGGSYTLSSPFGWRDNPVTGRSELHDGQDMAAPQGTPVLAASSGTVESSVHVDGGGFGIHIVISHGDTGITTLYGHLSENLVDVGQQVVTGQRIGAVGSTGLSTGPHLHFTVKQDGTAIDPAPFMAARAVPLDGAPANTAALSSTSRGSVMPAGSGDCQPGGAPADSGSGIVAAAQSQIGVPYSWGGGSLEGPSAGICCTTDGSNGAYVVGFDCSGLVRYAVYQATGVTLPRTVAAMLSSPDVQIIAADPASLQAGDLLFEGDHHIGIYDGHGGMIHAPQPGETIKLTPNVFSDPYHRSQITAAGRIDTARSALTADGAKRAARTLLPGHGWDAAQFGCLESLWNGESGWRWDAENPSSGAYGIPQALPASKMATAGADWRTNPLTQISWGLDYIAQRYGSPCQAWDFWQGHSPHWY
jgi:murein DD-endopeptidase MepM/ murein hydrolase activator NlpD